jgi:hypothetical protein
MLAENDLVALLYPDGEVILSDVDNLWSDLAYIEEIGEQPIPVVWETTGWEPVTR